MSKPKAGYTIDRPLKLPEGMKKGDIPKELLKTDSKTRTDTKIPGDGYIYGYLDGNLISVIKN